MAFEIGKPFSDNFVNSWLRKQETEKDLSIRDKALNQQWAMNENERRQREDEFDELTRRWNLEFDRGGYLSGEQMKDADLDRAQREKEFEAGQVHQGKQFDLSKEQLGIQREGQLRQDKRLGQQIENDERRSIQDTVRSLNQEYEALLEASAKARAAYDYTTAEKYDKRANDIAAEIDTLRKRIVSPGPEKNMPYYPGEEAPPRERLLGGGGRATPAPNSAGQTVDISKINAPPGALPAGLAAPPQQAEPRPMPTIGRLSGGVMGWGTKDGPYAFIGPGGSLTRERMASIFPEYEYFLKNGRGYSDGQEAGSHRMDRTYLDGGLAGAAEAEAAASPREVPLSPSSNRFPSQPEPPRRIDIDPTQPIDTETPLLRRDAREDRDAISGLSTGDRANLRAASRTPSPSPEDLTLNPGERDNPPSRTMSLNAPDTTPIQRLSLPPMEDKRIPDTSFRGSLNDLPAKLDEKGLRLEDLSGAFDRVASKARLDPSVNVDEALRIEMQVLLGDPSLVEQVLSLLGGPLGELLSKRLTEVVKPAILSAR